MAIVSQNVAHISHAEQQYAWSVVDLS